MIDIKDKTQCCGCTSCYNICPKSAIKMRRDLEGFLYPIVKEEKCIDCGMCKRVCPILHIPEKELYNEKSFFIRTKDDKVLSGSTSGGFITPLATWILSIDGVFCGASFDEKFRVKHDFAGGIFHYLEVLNMPKVI